MLVADCLPYLPQLTGAEAVPLESLATRLQEEQQVGVVLAPLVHPTTGAVLDIEGLVGAARSQSHSCAVGLELSDAVANFPLLDLRGSGADFAVFTTARYLGGGPDALTGVWLRPLDCSRGTTAASLWSRLEQYEDGACPVHRMAMLRESLDVLAAVPQEQFADKWAALRRYFAFLLEEQFSSLSPLISALSSGPPGDGPVVAMFSLSSASLSRELLQERRVAVDERSGHLLVSLVPFHTSFVDVYRFVQHLRELLASKDAGDGGGPQPDA